MKEAKAGAGEAYVHHARRLLEAAIQRRLQAKLLSAGEDGVVTGFLGAKQVVQILRADTEVVTPPPCDFDYGGTALGDLGSQLGLGVTELDLVAVLLVCEIDPVATRLAAFLGGNQVQFTMTLDVVLEIVYAARTALPGQAAALLHGDLAPERALRRLRLVLTEGEGRSMLAQSVRLHPRLVGWLLGPRRTALDGTLAARCMFVEPQEPVGECDPELLARVVAALSQPGRFLLVEGPRYAGRKMLVRFAAHRMNRPLLIAGLDGIEAEQMFGLFREALLQHALLALEIEAAVEAELVGRLRECMTVHPGTVAIICGERERALFGRIRPVVAVTVGVPPHEERRRLWRRYLGEDASLSREEWAEIGGLYNLGVAGIVQASEAARAKAEWARHAPTRACVGQAVRELFDTDLGEVAARVEVTQTWDDVVLPDDIGEAVLEVIDRIRYRGDVLGEWGFARKVGKGLGLTLLFSGEPGTGKSMVAGLMAQSLGLDLYVIDLGRVTSKWLGETEKNLGRAFDAAEAGHVLLLFDEADTVLGKRTSEIRTANDRYANLETNFILARLEQFQGVAVFTTNLPSGIDPAVMRRMTMHIRFPFPDEAARAELWERMIPAEAPRAREIDFERLGRKYELSGGFIRNIVLRAAFYARREGGLITTELLEKAAEAEYAARGALLVGGRLV
jgi:hypothetical protein